MVTQMIWDVFLRYPSNVIIINTMIIGKKHKTKIFIGISWTLLWETPQDKIKTHLDGEQSPLVPTLILLSASSQVIFLQLTCA